MTDAPTTAPLEGVRVIDLTRALAGPYCTLILAGLGADGLTLAATGPDDFSLAVLTRLRGKRSVTLNLKHPGAQEVFSDLVRTACRMSPCARC